ncbi:G protein-activated inward rectifier potassium channel 2 [Elysia marginata]|uniref:G protein-activated inward rectifier potassium channel 2 n=1 Tax=Elysia marginata TaxID=1093978 RepID=A0AAV4EW42_9GAST|nr:G protein-activated inward rectifier potassium channel 2 [Elysia marginata]
MSGKGTPIGGASESEVGGTIFLFSDHNQQEAATSRKRWWDILRVYSAGLSEHKRKYLADLYITLIDLEWRYALAVLFNVFLVTFMVFAIFWWLMAHNNGDFANLNNPDHEFCLLGVKSFPGAILFSIETQTTIGYGMAYPNADCGGTLPLMYLQVN